MALWDTQLESVEPHIRPDRHSSKGQLRNTSNGKKQKPKSRVLGIPLLQVGEDVNKQLLVGGYSTSRDRTAL